MADKVNLLLRDKETVAKLNVNRTKQLDKFAIENIAKSVNAIYLNLKSLNLHNFKVTS